MPFLKYMSCTEIQVYFPIHPWQCWASGNNTPRTSGRVQRWYSTLGTTSHLQEFLPSGHEELPVRRTTMHPEVRILDVRRGKTGPGLLRWPEGHGHKGIRVEFGVDRELSIIVASHRRITASQIVLCSRIKVSKSSIWINPIIASTITEDFLHCSR